MVLLPQRRWRCALWACLVCVIAAPVAFAESLDERLLADTADGRLDHFDLLSAALIAGGVSDACELDMWRGIHAELRGQISAEWTNSSDVTDRLTRIHAAMHEQILVGGYHATATDLRIALSRGDFNCLSALALYLDLCQAAGLDLEIWLLPGHVCIRCPESDLGWIEPGVQQPRRVLQLNPGKKPPIRDGGARVPSRQAIPDQARRISPCELLGKFYYNRGVLRLRERQFAEGLALLQTGLRLDAADRDARENLLAGINNWAVEQCRAKHYSRASELIEQGLTLDAAFAPLIANQRLVRGKLAQ